MQIVCPHCNHEFDLSGNIVHQLIEQIRTKEFDKELEERVDLVKKNAASDTKSKVSEAVSAEREKYESLLKDADIRATKAESDSKAKVVEAVALEKEKYEKLLKEADTRVIQAEAELKAKVAEAVAAEREKYDALLKDADSRAVKAESELSAKGSQYELGLREQELRLKTEFADKLSELESDKKVVERERDYYKDLKTKMSTKMIGETLEQHCEMEFNKIRMAAFPRAEFGKDNLVSKESGSKGDYIFREADEDGVEVVSIMFEMKNEMDTTSSKHKNEHFFKELDKDRKEKGCEYAVLVSLLESDSDLYNQGIVDVSYQYPKMYVIRPQCFVPMITLLRNAALNAHDDRRELMKVRTQNLDVSNFKDNFEAFKNGFGYNYIQAHKRLDEAVNEIDKAIARLQAVKDALTASDRQISLANKKVDDITIEKLCKNSPGLLQEFHDVV